MSDYSATSQMIYSSISAFDHPDFDYKIDYTDDQLEAFISDLIEAEEFHPDEEIFYEPEEQPYQPRYCDEITSINIFKNLELDDPDADPYDQINQMQFTCFNCNHYFIFHPELFSTIRAQQQEMREEDED